MYMYIEHKSSGDRRRLLQQEQSRSDETPPHLLEGWVIGAS